MRGSLLLPPLISRRHHFDRCLPFTSAGDIINGNKGRDGHFARTDLTGEGASARVPFDAAPPSLPNPAFAITLASRTCAAGPRRASIHYLWSMMSVLLFVCFTQWWKKMIRLPADFTSPAQITTKTTVSMETASSPTSWPSPPAGTHK